MHSFALVILILIPLVASIGVFLLKPEQGKVAKFVSLLVSLVLVAYVVVLTARFDTSPGAARFQYQGSWTWIKGFGVHFALGVDGIALVLVLMAVVLVPAVMLASWNTFDSRSGAEEEPTGGRRRSAKNFFALMLLLEFFMIGVFVATDVFLFYVFFEAMLVPMMKYIGTSIASKKT